MCLRVFFLCWLYSFSICKNTFYVSNLISLCVRIYDGARVATSVLLFAHFPTPIPHRSHPCFALSKVVLSPVASTTRKELHTLFMAAVNSSESSSMEKAIDSDSDPLLMRENHPSRGMKILMYRVSHSWIIFFDNHNLYLEILAAFWWCYSWSWMTLPKANTPRYQGSIKETKAHNNGYLIFFLVMFLL